MKKLSVAPMHDYAPCQSPYALPGVFCHKRIVPSSSSSQSALSDMRRYAKLSLRTTSACIHLSVRRVGHAVHWAMVSLENLKLLAIWVVDMHPRVSCAARDEPVAENWMHCRAGRLVWKRHGHRGTGMIDCLLERDAVAASDNQHGATKRQFHGSNWCVEVNSPGRTGCANVPPPGGGDCQLVKRHITLNATHFTKPSSAAVATSVSVIATTLLTTPSCASLPPSLKTSGSASGLPRS